MINSCQLIYVLVLFTFFSSYSMQPVEVIDEEDHKMKTLEDSFGRTSNLIDKKEKNSGMQQVEPTGSEPPFSVELDNNGLYHIDDMILDGYEFQEMYHGKSGRPNKQYRWPKGEVPYEFAGDHTPLEEKNITKYINHFNKILSGCIKLRPRTPNSEEYYVRIIKGSGCTSFFGNFEHRPNQGNYQNLSLGKNCINKRTVPHEFIHALGFDHEQNRPDRDDYVTIKWENIEPGKNNNAKRNFKKRKNWLTYDLPYDGKSVMHYKYNYFGKERPRLTTIESKMDDLPNSELGGDELTEFDILKLKRMYNCDEDVL